MDAHNTSLCRLVAFGMQRTLWYLFSMNNVHHKLICGHFYLSKVSPSPISPTPSLTCSHSCLIASFLWIFYAYEVRMDFRPRIRPCKAFGIKANTEQRRKIFLNKFPLDFRFPCTCIFYILWMALKTPPPFKMQYFGIILWLSVMAVFRLDTPHRHLTAENFRQASSTIKQL